MDSPHDSSALLRAVPLHPVHAGQDRDLVLPASSNRPCLISTSLTRLLTSCNTHRRFEDHVSAIASARMLNEDGRNSLRTALSQCLAQGLLISEQQLIERCRQSREAEQPPRKRIDTVGIVTRDRPSHLRKCIGSLVGNLRTFHRNTSIVVLDGSSEQARQVNRSLVAATSSETGISIRYGDLGDRIAFLYRLQKAGIPKEASEFCLLPQGGEVLSVGAGRNALLLETTQQLLLSLDDDTECRFSHHPEARKGLDFGSESDPMEFWFFRDRASATSFHQEEAVDLVGAHEALLGASPCHLLANWPDDIQITDACGHLFESLLTERGKIVLTFMGITGDSGMSCSGSLLTLLGSSYQRLTAGEHAFETALTSRELVRVAPCSTIGHSDWCMAYALGLDNSEFLPPFFPIFRNEDGLFGRLLQATGQHAFQGYVPWAIMHDPGPGRSYRPSEAFVTTVGFAELLGACINDCPISHAIQSRVGRFRILTTYLYELSVLPEQELSEYLQRLVTRLHAGRITLLESSLKRLDSPPDFWRRELKRVVETGSRDLGRRDRFVPHDLATLDGSARATALLKELLGRFANVMTWWPHMRQCTAELQQEGISLAPQTFC